MVFPGVRLCLRASFAGVRRSRVAGFFDWERGGGGKEGGYWGVTGVETCALPICPCFLNLRDIRSFNLVERKNSHASGIVSIRPPLLMARLVCNLAWFFLACGFAFGQASPESVDQEWRSYGHDPGGMRFFRLSPIYRANVPKLQKGLTLYTRETNLESFNGPPTIPTI